MKDAALTFFDISLMITVAGGTLALVGGLVKWMMGGLEARVSALDARLTAVEAALDTRITAVEVRTSEDRKGLHDQIQLVITQVGEIAAADRQFRAELLAAVAALKEDATKKDLELKLLIQQVASDQRMSEALNAAERKRRGGNHQE